MSCLINTSTTLAISARRWLDATGWPTGPEVASAPYRLGQGTAGITGHCVRTLCPRSAPTLHCVPPSPPRKQHRMDNLARIITASKPAHQVSRPHGASALCTKVSAILGFVPAETPHCGAASAPTKPRPHAQSIHNGLHVHRRTRSEAVPGLPRRTGSDGTSTPPQCSKDGPLRRPRRHRNRPQGSDMPPLLARRRIVNTCTVLVLPSTIKGEDLGHLEKERRTPCNTHTHTSQPPESNVSSSPHDTSPRPGISSLSHPACNPLLQALRCKEYKFDLSDWT